jgi:hypothetical protein
VIILRGDCDDIFLGSQYPLVHNIGPSQVPMSTERQVWNVQSLEAASQRSNQGQTKSNLKKQPNKTRVYVAPRTVEQGTGYKLKLTNIYFIKYIIDLRMSCTDLKADYSFDFF